MHQCSEEGFLRYIKNSESEVNTLAEIHKLFTENNMNFSIEQLRQKISLLCSDGYLGNEPTVEGVNMYYIIFNPEDTIESIDS